MTRHKFAASILLTLISLAACSGSAAPPTGGGTATGTAISTGAPTTAATVTSAPTATVAATQSPAGATSTPAAVADTCTLLSAADLNTATGDDYGEGVLDSVGQCVWRVGGASFNNGDGQVVLAITPNTLSAIKTYFPGGTDLQVAGHAAYWNPGEGLQSLWVDLTNSILVLSFDPVDADTQAAAQQLAEIALGNM